jgi:secreted trypsin-like serine protease
MFIDFKKALAVFGLSALVSCSAACAAPVDASDEPTIGSAQQAITNADDDDDDKAVVALLQGGKVYCTGVLVAKGVVATAAHCVTPSPPEQVYFGSKPSSKKGTFIAVSDSKIHPDFDEDTLANDIAVVGLASRAPVAPVPVLTKPFTDAFVGKAVRIVGFGAPAAGEENNLRKRSGETTIATFGDDDFRFKPGPSQTCNGDSGGPAFAMIGDVEAVIGISSSGDADCNTYGRDMRIDQFVDFISSYTKKYSVPGATGPDENQGCSMTSTHPRSGGAGAAALLIAIGCALTLRRRLLAQ